MAHFCEKCTSELFGGEIENDFKGLITQKEIDDGYVVRVLCEGCGTVEVDPEGVVLKVIKPAEKLQDYDYDKFTSDSSDDHPKYADGLS